jgi:hypothetical protein
MTASDDFHRGQSLTKGIQDPTDSSVSATDNNPDVGNLTKQLETLRWSTVSQVVHLSRVEEVLTFAQDLGPLSPARFGIDEHQQGMSILQRRDLE